MGRAGLKGITRPMTSDSFPALFMTVTRHRSSDLRRSAALQDVRRIYAVDDNSSSAQGCCYLEDGSAVICAFETLEAGLEATADDPNLRLVSHRSLSPREQKRVESALLA